MLNRNYLTNLLIYLLFVNFACSESMSGPDVRIITETTTLLPGMPFLVGIHFKLPEHGHIYWQNPGNSGLPTEIQWTLPEGFKAGPLLWPYPQRFEAPDDVTYGYKNEVMLMCEITPPPNLQSGQTIQIGASVKWMFCAESCIPGEKDLILEMRMENADKKEDKQRSILFDHWKNQLPITSEKLNVFADLQDHEIHLIVLPRTGSINIENLFVFPQDENIIDPNEKEIVTKHKNGILVRLKLSPYLQHSLQRFRGVLVMDLNGFTKQTVEAFSIDTLLNNKQGE